MNRLSLEKSPYLLQHKNNPVDWYPWCDEAFEKARIENKPIFLSVGYSSCHWCHVMEEESFVDPSIAKILNERFISIKVDREERPDVDSLYMLVCQMMTGHGGWPLSIFMTASQQAFFAGTYFPPKSTGSRLGFQEVLERISYLWIHQKKEIHTTVQTIETAILESLKNSLGTENTETLVKKCVRELEELWDSQNGGFGSAPKFPSPHKLLFLLMSYKESKDTSILNKVVFTLEKMHSGGLYDHIRGGFHRYSTDAMWKLPHFEKMLYDQALCARLYLEAYQITKKNLFKHIAQKTIRFVETNMKNSEGGYFSALNADSQGEEGAYYVWEYSELKKSLSDDHFKNVSKIFDIQPEGNFLDEATGEAVDKNILYLKEPIINDKSIYFSMDQVWDQLEKVASMRERPSLDNKILSDWNALYLQTLYIAYDVLGDPEYLKIARYSMDFFEKNIFQKNEIFHRYCDREILKLQFLDDYAGFISVYLQDYRLTQREESLERAVDFCDVVLEFFYDDESGGFFQTRVHDQKKMNSNTGPRHRTKDFYDGAYPSSNSYMIENLVFLWFLTGQSRYKKTVEKFIQKSTLQISDAPSSFCYLIRSLFLWEKGCVEIKVFGKWSLEDQAKIESILRERFLPEKIIKNLDSDRSYIQICRGGSCGLPLMSIETFKKEISLLYSV